MKKEFMREKLLWMNDKLYNIKYLIRFDYIYY